MNQFDDVQTNTTVGLVMSANLGRKSTLILNSMITYGRGLTSISVSQSSKNHPNFF